MGNWLKGRVVIIPDQDTGTTATSTTVTATTSNTTGSNSAGNRYCEQIVAALASSNAPPHNYHHQLSDDPYSLSQSIYYPPYSSSLFNQFTTEEKQIQLAKRIGLIQHLPTGTYDGGGSGSDSGGGNGDGSSTKNLRECVICMVEFSKGDSIRFLPCLHTYHVHCIDDWLMRSFICPSCMEPVDVALLNTL